MASSAATAAAASQVTVKAARGRDALVDGGARGGAGGAGGGGVDLGAMKFSMNLVNFAIKQLNFLNEVDEFECCLYEGKLFQQALYRYENYWLAFNKDDSLLSHEDLRCLIPPVDVCWVWHCHMLCPISDYNDDCMRLCGRHLDDNMNIYCSKDERLKREASTRKIWESKFRMSYDFTVASSSSSLSVVPDAAVEYKSRLKHDLAKISKVQKNFLYQVSLPHYYDRKYLELGVERYKKFLHLKKLSAKSDEDLNVPCNLINLVWRSHKLNPKIYESDMKALKIWNETEPAAEKAAQESQASSSSAGQEDTASLNSDCGDVSTSVNNENSLLNLMLHDENSGASIWRSVFNESFYFAGSMPRGSCNTSLLAVNNSSSSSHDQGGQVEQAGQQQDYQLSEQIKSLCGVYRRFCLIDLKLINETRSHEVTDDSSQAGFDVLIFKRNFNKNSSHVAVNDGQAIKEMDENDPEDFSNYCDPKRDLIHLNKIYNYKLNNDHPLQICLNVFSRKETYKSLFHLHSEDKHDHHHHLHHHHHELEHHGHHHHHHHHHHRFIEHILKNFKHHRKTAIANYCLQLRIPANESEQIQEFQVGLNDHSKIEYLLSLKFQVSQSLSKGLEFSLKKSSFQYVDMNKITYAYKEFDLINKDFSNAKGQAINAIHEIQVLVEQPKGAATEKTIKMFNLEILHIISLKWSSIRLLAHDTNKILATSHLIDNDQLPNFDQVLNTFGTNPLITLNSKYEKAMLVRNITGDYAIVKAKWVETHPLGYLAVTIYYFSTKSVKKFEIKRTSDFELKNNFVDSFVDVKNGDIFMRLNNYSTSSKSAESSSISFKVNESVEMASSFALVFSICLLHVLLEPKSLLGHHLKRCENYKPDTQHHHSANQHTPKLFHFGKSVSIHDEGEKAEMHDHVLLDCMGYRDLIQNHCFLNTFKDNSFTIDSWVFNEFELLKI